MKRRRKRSAKRRTKKRSGVGSPVYWEWTDPKDGRRYIYCAWQSQRHLPGQSITGITA